MLNTEIKRKIDGARQILVGKVPDPKAQVEQITTALIYKFMDDMDKESVELGGKIRFFTKEYERYAWSKIIDSKLGGLERLNLYGEAIAIMQRNPSIPQLFRDIFKDAFLPYRDPETLSLFLKEINSFTYDHSENLGNAFEYLLSVLGSQGDAGQFRTPRHIIDFIVEVVHPTKDDKILDPACGTAGFLISAFKNILAQHDGIDTLGKKNNEKPLTPDERNKMTKHFVGYDISPDMVRLSLVNLYLHGFQDPKIFEYDTLTSEEKWDETFDVILANPPFMTPTGGIRPHKRFSVQANRAEVLFVNYIMEHLNPKGRAGIIVPESIIFKTESAYKNLRKLMLEDGLYSVISLPGGVFNPYSGVKTNILLFDKEITNRSNNILFVNISSDGYDLGAQRREIKNDDLPRATELIKKYQESILKDGGKISLSEFNDDKFARLVDKKTILDTKDVTLSGDRYRAVEKRAVEDSIYKKSKLLDIIEIDFGTRITQREYSGSKYPVYGGGGESFRTDESPTRRDELVISRFAMSENCVRIVRGDFFLLDSGFTYHIKESATEFVRKNYLDQILLGIQDKIYACGRGQAQKNIDIDRFLDIELPIPSLEEQDMITVELESYQAIIEASEKIKIYFKPVIEVSNNWKYLPLGEVLQISSSTVNPIKEKGTVFYVGLENIESNTGRLVNIKETDYKEIKSNKNSFKKGEILYGKLRPNLNKVWLADRDGICSTDIIVLKPTSEDYDVAFYYFWLLNKKFNNVVLLGLKGAQLPRVSYGYISEIEIPVPDKSSQVMIANAITQECGAINKIEELANSSRSKLVHLLEKIWQ